MKDSLPARIDRHMDPKVCFLFGAPYSLLQEELHPHEEGLIAACHSSYSLIQETETHDLEITRDVELIYY